MIASRRKLKAPFPYFGGKSRVAKMVWERFGSPRNYIEPFAGSLAMLLNCEDEPKIETCNDINGFIVNFWRAIKNDPEGVARHADGPVFEADLHSRHRWLVTSRKASAALAMVRRDPDYFNAKIAGWWCHGACMWIGSGWCDQQLPHVSHAGQGVLSQQLPHVSHAGQGVLSQKLPHDGETPGKADKRPQLCCGNTTAGNGVHGHADDPELQSGRGMLPQKLPELQGAVAGLHQKLPVFPDGGGSGRGVAANPPLWQQIPTIDSRGDTAGPRGDGRPQLADAYSRGRGVHGNDVLTDCQRRRLWLTDWFTALADRLRAVRVCCGHWDRVCDSPSTMTRLGTTAVFLDPPYRKRLADGTANRSEHIYANDKAQDVDALCDEVQAWCLKWGPDKDVRIALCGLEGEYPALDAAGWEKVAWKSQGGYGNRNQDNENAKRERIWLSPNCLPAVQRSLFDNQMAPDEEPDDGVMEDVA